MIKDSKSQVDEITKLRKILDNPSDPQTQQLLSEKDHALLSMQKRLFGTEMAYISRFRHTDVNLEPKITIRPRITTTVQRVAPLPEFTPVESIPVETIPEFIPVTQPTQSIPVVQQTFSAFDLIEIEKVDNILPQFVEVLTNTTPVTMEEKPLQTDAVTPLIEDLPEWQPFHEEQPMEPYTIAEQSSPCPIPDRTQETISSTLQDNTIEPSSPVPEFEPTLQQKDLVPEQTPSEFNASTSLQPPRLTWRQRREAKKAEKQRQKVEEQLQKQELQQAPWEQENNETNKTNEQDSPQNTSEPLEPSENDTEAKPPSIKVDLTAFQGLKSVDENTARLLYEHGYFSLKHLKDAAVSNLVQIRGIKRKQAKLIKKEVELKTDVPVESEFIPLKEKITVKPRKELTHDFSEWEHDTEDKSETSPKHTAPYTQKGYTLYKKEIKGNSGKKTTMHFFSKEQPAAGIPTNIPIGYLVAINKKTGVPYLKKKK
jgi:hypothetical protein